MKLRKNTGSQATDIIAGPSLESRDVEEVAEIVWQQKVFGPLEYSLYSRLSDPKTEREKQYVNLAKQQKGARRICTYIDSDREVLPPTMTAAPTTSSMDQPTQLVCLCVLV